MELFLFRHAEYERLYNCTAFPIDSVPLERRRQFVAGGIAKCVFCAIYYVLYVPCMYSIWKHFHENSCYKLLFYIGIADLGILWILGFFSGWLSLSGGVFCSSPTLMYLVGVAVTGTVLALNRCLELGFAKLSHLLFSGHRIYACLFACSLYALCSAVLLKPVLYSSIFFGWFFDPFVGYRTADQLQQREEVGIKYGNGMHPVKNYFMAFWIPFIYLLFALKLFYNVRTSRREFEILLSEMDSTQIRVFIQVLLISAMNTLTCSLYAYLHRHEVVQWMITLAEFSWLSARHLFDTKQNNPRGLPPAVHESVQTKPYRPYWRGYCRPFQFNAIQRNRSRCCSTDEFLKIEPNNRIFI
ncbi:hypothetical protein niasHS_001825 [Heterodera schachtii]|uniref:Uncharacterized protein n=1 Tax=Heterodera schachtii TaxID=97005 RepID=A0ABD2KAE9_HETSC